MQPRIVGRYAVFDEVAAGGMATVHFGRLLAEAGFSRTVAIKRLHPQFARDPDFVTMFLDEARLASRIRHPNVVSTLDVVANGEDVLLVMEYVVGESLSRLTKAAKPGTIPVPIAIAIMTNVFHGLHAAHEAKTEQGKPLEIVHRDVSPQNILVGTDGVARVLDFGVAKASHRANTTKEGQIKGKLAYMAPEQLRRDTVDRRCDIWAASVVLWEAICGERLFDGESEARTVLKVLEQEVPKPSSKVSGLPTALDALVLKGLAREPEQRFATAREMAVALERCGIAAAPASSIGEWVESLANESLEKKASRIHDIERVSDQGLPPAPPPSQPEIKIAFPPPRTQFESLETMTAPEQPTSNVSYATARTVPGAAPKNRLRPLLVVAALLAIAGASAGVWTVIGRHRDVAAAAPTASQPTALATPTPPPPPEDKTIAAPPPTTSVATTDSPTSAPVRAPTPLIHPIGPKLPAQPSHAARCTPPYSVDANGIRHLKPECL
ncbi:MAG TPA: protein kinase [Labilithrix sp.]